MAREIPNKETTYQSDFVCVCGDTGAWYWAPVVVFGREMDVVDVVDVRIADFKPSGGDKYGLFTSGNVMVNLTSPRPLEV